ncbi:MAG TPA: hypothetical protein VGC99_06660 [Candidatus Tectomicrobia bacterium]
MVLSSVRHLPNMWITRDEARGVYLEFGDERTLRTFIPIHRGTYTAIELHEQLEGELWETQPSRLHLCLHPDASADVIPPASAPPSRHLHSSVDSPQALRLQESRRLQDALTERAHALGWFPAAIRDRRRCGRPPWMLGHTLPGIWVAEGLSPQQRDALWCLIDTGVVHRIRRETMQTRMVWTGGPSPP